MNYIEILTPYRPELYVGRKAVLHEQFASWFVVIERATKSNAVVRHGDGYLQKASWGRLSVEIKKDLTAHVAKDTMEFKFESNRKLNALRKAAYDDTFTSADAARCSDVLYAIANNAEVRRPKEQRDSNPKRDEALFDEWCRVTKIALLLSTVP